MGVEIEEVMERFTLIADLGSAAASRYRPLCLDAMAEINRKIRNNDPAAQGILCAAAASLALYRWALMNASDSVSSFAAGDVKVTKSADNVAMARQAWREAAAAAAPYLEDSGFVFERICK
jgi:hypothetical protein